MPAQMIDAIRARLHEVQGLRPAIETILDWREARGALPRRITLTARPDVESALAELFSSLAVRHIGPDRVRVNLDKARAAAAGVDIEEILYAAVGRVSRDRRAEQGSRIASALADLVALQGEARSVASRAYCDAQIELTRAGKGEYLNMLGRAGSISASDEWPRMLALVDAAVANTEPVRIATFSARVAQDSKWLAANADRVRRLGALLAKYDPATRMDLLEAGIDAANPAMPRLALEARGVFRDEGAVSVLCFGPLAYEKSGDNFDHVARHARRGEPCRLTLQQLRGARIEAKGALRVTVIENLTSFFEYVELVAREPEAVDVVVASEGQASWAVVELVRALGRSGLPVRHAGDLDRSGVLIARSLAERAGISLELAAMAASTHDRFAERGLRLSSSEAERMRALLDTDPPDALGHELLLAIARTGVWIEQERFLLEALVGHP